MSLKELLHQKIKEAGYLPYEQVVGIALEEGYKISNAERRLRHSESPEVQAMPGISKRGTKYIKGYMWVGEKVSIKITASLVVNAINAMSAFKVAPKETKNQLL